MADAFVCVFVGPGEVVAFVVPKSEFDIVRERTASGNWLSFTPEAVTVDRRGVNIDVSRYAEGWSLLDNIS
jgi:hypothetical protein